MKNVALQRFLCLACTATLITASDSQHVNDVEPSSTATCFAPSDSDPFACMGNGAWCCDSDSNCACRCNDGWKGPSCSTLDLLPIPRSSVGVPASTSTNMGANWGGGVVYEGGYWHAFIGAKTDLSDGASDEFAWNHGIIHLRSSTLGGNWENMGELKGIYGGNFGFRVDIKADPSGGWLLMTEGFAAGDDRYPWNERFGFIFLHADSVYGPWTERLAYRLGRTMPDGSTNWQADPSNEDDNRWDCRMADPTFVVMEDSSVYIGYRGTKCCCDEFIGAWGSTGEHEVETAGLLRASSWEGPFDRVGVKIFEDGSDNEDMHLWRDGDGGVHMLMHSQRNDHHNHERRGAHAYSPDGAPTNWRLSHEEAWPTFLYYDDCGADAIVKRQRPGLVFDPETGKPTHLLTGVASSHHGLEWGDGWTVFQPINGGGSLKNLQESDCSLGPCPVGSIANANGGCNQCVPSDIPGCLVATSSPSRDQCICKECANGNVGDFCDVSKAVASTTCPNDGWKLLPGTNDGRLFRCGEVINFAHFDEASSSWVGGTVGGWWGNCVSSGVINNGETNCGDNSDEGTASAVCQWPSIRMADGTCEECEDNDVSNKCLPGQAIPSETGQTCVCQKCVNGWIGDQCDIEIGGNNPTLPPTNAPTSAGCFSKNYKDCLPKFYSASCDTVWLPNGPQQNCIALWEDCTGDSGGCCGDAVCFGDADHAACVPPAGPTDSPTPKPTTLQPTPPTCTVCDDRETKWQLANGFDCATDAVRMNEKCNKSAWWTQNGYCRLSCYNAGNGYPGDVCCGESAFDRKNLRGR